MKTYAPKPPKGPISALIEGKSKEFRYKKKAEEFAKVGKITWVKDSVIFKVSEIEAREVTKDNGEKTNFLYLKIDIRKGGIKYNLGDNKIQFVNPPLTVSNGTYRKKNIGGKEVDAFNFEENVSESLKLIIYNLCKSKMPELFDNLNE